MLLINKSSSIGWSYNQLKESKTALGFDLISVLHSILDSWETNRGGQIINENTQELKNKYKGLVKEAYLAMYHDFHGLAVQIDMIQHLFVNRKNAVRHKDFLYVSEIVEKYLSNLRSIYDFMAKVLRLAVKQRYFGQINFDSLNSLIESVEKRKTAGKIPEGLKESLLSIKDEFLYVRGMRDSIIHNGEQISIMPDDDGYYLRIWSEEKGKKVYVPLLNYLSERTIEMFNFGEKIGVVIFNEFCKEYGDIPFRLVALEGVRIPTFINFLGILPDDE